MYNFQGLKAKKKLKSKLEWLMVRNVVDRESYIHRSNMVDNNKQSKSNQIETSTA